MMLRRLLLLLLCLGLAGPVAAGDPPAGQQDESAPGQQEAAGAEETPYGATPDELVPYRRSAEPYRRFFTEPLAFRGPGRGKPEPGGLESVRIGLLAPLEEGTPDAALGRSMERGVTLALEEANQAGGHGGVPFSLVPKNDQALWGASSNTLVELAYEDRVWAVIGSIDSNSTHVAIRAALKAEIPVVAVGSTDPTMTETGIPWVIRATPDDRQTGYRLARLVFDEAGHSRVAVLRSSDRYGRFGVREFRDAARRLGRPLPMEILLRPELEEFGSALDRIAATKPDAIVLWTRARQAGLLVRALRRRGMRQPVYGTDRLVSPEFLATAGPAGEGAVATTWIDPGGEAPAWMEFRRRFAARFGTQPDAFAAYGYDAARMVIDAVNRTGLNRARIRDELTGLRSYDGVAGAMTLDVTSNNVSPLFLAEVRDGRFVPR